MFAQITISYPSGASKHQPNNRVLHVPLPEKPPVPPPLSPEVREKAAIKRAPMVRFLSQTLGENNEVGTQTLEKDLTDAGTQTEESSLVLQAAAQVQFEENSDNNSVPVDVEDYPVEIIDSENEESFNRSEQVVKEPIDTPKVPVKAQREESPLPKSPLQRVNSIYGPKEATSPTSKAKPVPGQMICHGKPNFVLPKRSGVRRSFSTPVQQQNFTKN